ncbi:MAG: BMP family ABC transporter substrate-binding protein, partial [Alphaproteobacteria bacterium]|nr:BMP family ABC transporter substrate-binding protein [Alphaproteobacteria bacterium]
TLNIFEGPMKDNQGNMVLDAGKVLDDGGLWGMNYYVEGVEGSIPN